MTLYDYFSIAWRMAIAALFIVITLAAAAFLFPQQVLTVDSGDRVKGDALVILGGGDGRVERCAQLYHQGAAPLVLVTGYGDCMTNVEQLEKLGVPSNVITTEAAALSTMQNAAFSVPLLRALQVHRVIIVTSWFHSRRALACFEHVAPDMTFYSRPSYMDFQPKSQNRTGYSWHVNYEYVKLVGYFFVHGVSPF